MSSLPVNIVDLIVIVVLLLSALLALFRGIVKEVLSILGWVAALAATYFFFPVARDIARSYIESRIFADIAAGAALFLPTLILCSLATHWISEQVRASAVSAVDRSLGFLFGLARGALIVIVAWWVTDRLIPPPTQPVWLLEARTRPLAVAGYTWGMEMVMRQLDPSRPPATRAEPQAQPTPIPSHQTPGQMTGRGADSRGQTGYKTEERQGIESLIKTQDKP
ncbi:MAG TPA: CvpA family protein [Ferrovibrio sp.]|uniref:CvpA family protein n=1 Tax=Ferrovibrio sp. TaxID=1917215 RepID=UPI002B4B93EA|nr:CvpA family protein [Ferrovibrio sp.]HLT78334.1 CvpA family protein [Ferrovibrio sp.]